MEIKDVELLRAVLEAGSLTGACHRLAVSQPTLSKRLARLETQLGVTLFQRYSTGLVATPVTDYILDRAAPLRAQLTAIERQVALMGNLQAGEVRVGVGPIVEQLLLPGVLRAFMGSTESVTLSIVSEGDADKLFSLFTESSLDVLVGPYGTGGHDSERVLALPMLADDVVAVARPGHPCLQAPLTDLKQLHRYGWATPNPRGTSVGQPPADLMASVRVYADSYDTLKRLTRENDIICPGPRGVFAAELAAGELRELDIDLGLRWSSALLVRREAYATPLVRHLVDLFVAQARLSAAVPGRAPPDKP